MITEKVFSPYNDKKIVDRLNNSIIWEKAFKEDELTKEVKDQYKYMYCYSIKFDGTIPVQVRIKKLVKFD